MLSIQRSTLQEFYISLYSFFLQSPSIIIIFFFFQAEDGIRDADVTGVQTCALPIFLHPEVLLLRFQLLPAAGAGAGGRSEERRVGKECRSRWSRYHLKKNMG